MEVTSAHPHSVAEREFSSGSSSTDHIYVSFCAREWLPMLCIKEALTNAKLINKWATLGEEKDNSGYS